MAQELFHSDKFEWTPDDWYKLTPINAVHTRNVRIKELKAKGYNPTKFSLGGQLLSKGGIGSGKPHIEYFTKVYGINY